MCNIGHASTIGSQFLAATTSTSRLWALSILVLFYLYSSLTTYFFNLSVDSFNLCSAIDVNQQDEIGSTALHLACEKGNVELVRLLLEYGGGKSVEGRRKEGGTGGIKKEGGGDLKKVLCLQLETKPCLFVCTLYYVVIFSMSLYTDPTVRNNKD